MFRKGTTHLLLISLALAMIFVFSRCDQLRVNNLKSNYYFNRANHYFSDGLYRSAIAEYESALKFNPNRVEAYRYLGESYKQLYRPGIDSPENMGRAENAFEALQKALNLEPANKQIIYSLGDMYDKMRNFEVAEKYYLKILELEPANMNNYYVIAEFYRRYSGEREELKEKAEAMFLRRIEADPEDPQGYAYVANYYNEMTPIPEFDKAHDFYLKRVALEPENAELFYSIGVNRFMKAYRLQNVLPLAERRALAEESEKNLLKAMELDPLFPWSYAYMRMLYVNVHVNVWPERESRLRAEADGWGEKFDNVSKRDAERKKLEAELKKII